MIDLDFVKKIDKNWENSVIKVYVKRYSEKHCTNCGSIINSIN